MKKLIYALSLAAAVTLPGAATAQAKPPVKLGYITATTGPLGAYGKAQSLMVKLAVEDVNAAGGVNGSLIEVEEADAQMDPGQAVLLFRKFAGEDILGVVGPMTGTQWETVSSLANRLGLPAITATASKPGITVRPWTIRLQPPDDLFIADGFKDFHRIYPDIRRVVIVADVREASGKAGAEAYEQLAKEAGIEVVEIVEFSTRATDLSPVAIKVKGLNPDAILVSALGPNALMLAKEFKVQKVDVPVLGNSLIWPGPFVYTVGDNGKNWHTIGFTTMDSSTGDNALNASVVKRFLEQADSTMGQPANSANWSMSYDAVLLYADIMRRNHIDGNTPAKEAREIIKDAFMKLDTFSGIQTYTFRDTGDAHIPGRVLIVDTDKHVWKFASDK
ncbi:ABC transporter substrate-binding protein [Pusillimonas noertemannii]|uniref:ABC-type branched-subunit amino acid transport system substrate-binding protein n=2 Tax=Pusillimonas noertemannii TaxID=305977 RepID=A0A2U1CRL3_9BURK|nr:ABC transporter substrate-binding protein [Pusillimonas noertemannii]NYT67771.1 ABC transporter substrate-binding protein [Pusillimonas noertemannii]PVY68441.1 ABC-type branched-subunit amino acid transport system substrate-binding protein [Pusillimonas noertemannii]TFL12077.1 amino acid ABC transporter substrate-binding protein [Pusillimonas noertemannii]